MDVVNKKASRKETSRTLAERLFTVSDAGNGQAAVCLLNLKTVELGV